MLTISTHHYEFLRSLLGTNDHYLIFEVINGNVFYVGSVTTKETDVGLLNP